MKDATRITRTDLSRPDPGVPDWILSQFAKTRAVAQERYAKFVSEGKRLPSPWTELRGQVLLGSDAFAERMGPLLSEKENSKEIPRAQRLANRPGLARLFRAAVLPGEGNPRCGDT